MGRGTRSTLMKCSACGEFYTKTNFMARVALLPDGSTLASNTHEIRCKGWEGFKTFREAVERRESLLTH